MTVADDLTTARANIASLLATITASPKPSYTVNGQTFSWIEYQRFLLDAYDRLTDAVDAETAPFEEMSQGFT